MTVRKEPDPLPGEHERHENDPSEVGDWTVCGQEGACDW